MSQRRSLLASLVAVAIFGSSFFIFPPVSAKEVADMDAPPAPRNLVVRSLFSSQVDFAWESGSYEGTYSSDTYVVYRKVGNGTDFSNADKLVIVGGGTKFYMDTTVAPDTTYTYKVAAVNQGKEGVNSAGLTVTTPPAPFMTSAQALSSTKVEVTWNEQKNAKLYNLYRSTVSGNYERIASSLTTNHYTDTGVVASTDYVYYAEVISNDGLQNTAGYAQVKTLATDAAPVPPAPPAVPMTPPSNIITLTGYPLGSNGIYLLWNVLPNATSYELYRSDDNGASFIYRGSLYRTEYSDTYNLLPNKDYIFYIKPRFATGEGAASSKITIRTEPDYNKVESLVAPVISAQPISASQIKISWQPVVGADRYTIFRSLDRDVGQVGTLRTVTDSSYIDTPANANQTYSYYIVAERGAESSPLSNRVYTSLKDYVPPSTIYFTLPLGLDRAFVTRGKSLNFLYSYVNPGSAVGLTGRPVRIVRQVIDPSGKIIYSTGVARSLKPNQVAAFNPVQSISTRWPYGTYTMKIIVYGTYRAEYGKVLDSNSFEFEVVE